MKACASCGAQNGDAARFCATCGSKLELVPVPESPAPHNGGSNGSEGSAGLTFFCKACGKPVRAPLDRAGMQVTCSACQSVITVPKPPLLAKAALVKEEEPARPAPLAFKYVALTATKERVTGLIRASSRLEAIRAVERLGHFPLTLSAAEPVAPKRMVSAEKARVASNVELPDGKGMEATPLDFLDDTPPADVATAGEPGERFEIVRRNGECADYGSAAALRDGILQRRLGRETKVRKVVVDEAGTRTEEPWTTLEKLETDQPPINALYRPVWHWSVKFILYGAVGGFVLKLLDTTVCFFSAKEELGFLWLAALVSLALSKKWPIAPIVGFLIILKSGISDNPFSLLSMFAGGLFSTVLVGALFGSIVGLFIGTVVGHFKAPAMQKAPDARPEGWRPYQLGMLAPLALLAVLVPLYLWLINKIADSL